ncbi:MAG TPA: hypothetical protein VFB29_05110 [Pseudolabrys sp.]|nr:hypothetical protein [Pseudolabrys sp.]
MRHALSITIVAALVTAVFVDIVAAGVKAVSSRHQFYYATPATGVSVAEPGAVKRISPDLLPQ